MKRMLFFFLLFPLLTLAQTNFDKAEELYNAKKYNQAEPIFESCLKANPSDLRIIEYLGSIAGHLKYWDKAIVYYKKLKLAKPSEANYYFKYGGALAMKAKESNKFKALGMIGEVKASFEKAIELNPKHIEARWGLVILYINLPSIVGGSETKAIRYSNELLKLSPVDGYLSRGQIEEYYERYPSAEEQYKKAIAVGSTKVGVRMLTNLYKNKMKQPEKVANIKI